MEQENAIEEAKNNQSLDDEELRGALMSLEEKKWMVQQKIDETNYCEEYIELEGAALMPNIYIDANIMKSVIGE